MSNNYMGDRVGANDFRSYDNYNKNGGQGSQPDYRLGGDRDQNNDLDYQRRYYKP